MGSRGLKVAVAALMMSARLVAAQQPGGLPPGAHGQKMMRDSVGMMRMMDSLDARLDTLVTRMNKATGDRKVGAMADVINELVAQRRRVHKHMRGMMGP